MDRLHHDIRNVGRAVRHRLSVWGSCFAVSCIPLREIATGPWSRLQVAEDRWYVGAHAMADSRASHLVHNGSSLTSVAPASDLPTPSNQETERKLSSQYEVLIGRLTGKVILIVGATYGIGRAVALRVADERATVVVAGRRADLC